MKRKLIQLSPSTTVISLPSAWVKRNKLKKGMELELEDNENKLVVSTKSDKSEKEITIDIRKLTTKMLWLAIDAAYITGYDSIHVLTKDAKQSTFMSKVVRYFPGMIIVEERKTGVLFKDMAQDQRGDVHKILSRINNMALVLFEEGIQGSKEKDWELLTSLKKRDYNINSYVSYCLRQINKFGFTPFSKTGIMHSYLKVLEILCDKISALFTGIGEKEVDLKDDVKVVEELLVMYRELWHLHNHFSMEKISEFDLKRQKLKKKLPKMHVYVKIYVTEILELLHDLEELEMQLNV